MNTQVDELNYAIKYYSMLLLAYAITPIGSVLAILALPCFLIMQLEEIVKKTPINKGLKNITSITLKVLRYATAPAFLIGGITFGGVLTIWNNLDHMPKPYSTKRTATTE